MKHGNKNRKFNRKTNVRLALMRSLAIALIERNKIKTTEAKAKELRKFIEPIITRGRIDSVFNKRVVSSLLGNNKDATKIVFAEISPRYKDRSGGYTRVVKLSSNRDDAAKMAFIEFV